MVNLPRLLPLVLCLCVAFQPVYSAKSSTSKKPASAQKAPAAKKSTAKTTRQTAKSSKKAKSRRGFVPKQTAPTPERMREIQKALSDHGFPVEASGTLGPETAEALKAFQQKQNIDATGKLNSLTLIALGLGPKREAATAQANPPAQKDPSQ